MSEFSLLHTDALLAHDLASPTHFGEGLVVALYHLLKGASLYHRGNEIVNRLVVECLLALRDTASTARCYTVTLQVGEDAAFCNRRRVRISADTLAPSKALLKLLRQRGVGGLELDRDLSEETLRLFAFAFEALEEQGTGNAQALTELLQQHEASGLRVRDLAAGAECAENALALKRRSKEIYFSTLEAVKDLMTKTSAGHELELRRVKRLMMSTVHLLAHEESTLLGLANIKSYDDYTFSHSVNVGIFAVALGQRAGLPRLQLYHLGICGLFHDVGKQAVPREVLNKPGALTPAEWEIIRTHPVRGAEMILQRRQWGGLRVHIMAAAFEHHLKVDSRGYPPLLAPRTPSLFSRIITIADCYDALSRPRIYRKSPFLSDRILGVMLQHAGQDFDLALVKLFINMVGVYPLGALVRLNTDQLALVTRTADSSEQLDRPQVCLLQPKPDGYEKGDTLDLTTTDPATGAYPYTITGILDPNAYGIQVEELYL